MRVGRRALLVVSLASGLTGVLATRPGAAAPLPDTIDKIRASVVGVGTVQLTRRPPSRVVATGFAVGDGQHVVTNAHALPRDMDHERKEFLAVITQDRTGNVRKAEVVKVDLAHDLALLKISGPRLVPMRLGNSSQVREGELFAFTGFPIGEVLGMRPVTHRGIVSSITPIAIPQLSAQQLDVKLIQRLSAPYDVFQLDATAYPGNSGSPLYAVDTGLVVGVVNKVFVKESKENVLENPSGITYAIPIEHASALLRTAGVAQP